MQVYFGLDSTAVPLWNDTLSSPLLITQELRLPQNQAEAVLERLGTIFDSSPQDIQNTWIVFGGDMDYLASKFTTAVYAAELEQVVALITGLWISPV